MSNISIRTFEFSAEGNQACANSKHGKNWPVVYLINNDTELYVGETSNMNGRFKQHLENPERRNLAHINVIFDDEFNKSAILDIEQTLIQYLAVDDKYKLQNVSGGQSPKHNYYQREKYLNKIDEIWEKLSKKGLTSRTIQELKNDDLFKFSPYNTLTEEQNEVCNDIITNMLKSLRCGLDGTAVINGTVGTGKTVVMISTLYKLLVANELEFDPSEEDFDLLSENMKVISDLKQYYRENGPLKIAFVLPMASIRSTIKKVFAKTKNGLKSSLVVGPLDVSKEKFDVVFIDESHRLPRYKNYMNKKAYKDACARLDLDYKVDTTLDMIVKNSKYRVMVYDSAQRIKEQDMDEEQFKRALANSSVSHFYLNSQLRCKGGEEYIEFINMLFNPQSDRHYAPVENFDLKLFSDVDQMVSSIKELDKKYGLCRNVAGYSWKWISKGCSTYQSVIDHNLQDIVIGPYKYVWNMTDTEFIISKNAVNEIGCVHTTQGYDLNYVGLIFGPEIDYDPVNNEIVIDVSKFCDSGVKKGATKKDVELFIINAYKNMMARGIRGCYLFACNKNMENYLYSRIKSIT